MHLSQACEQFLTHCRYSKKLSEHTLRAYDIDLTEFLRFATRKRVLKECDKRLLTSYLRYLFEERGLKESSVKRRIACLKAMFRWLEYEEHIEANPFQKFPATIKLPGRLPRGLNRAELKALLQAPIKSLGFDGRRDCSQENLLQAAGTRHGLLQVTTLTCLEILFSTGIRVAELTAIRLKDLNLGEGSLKIHGKGDRERMVFLPDAATVRLVRAYIRARAAAPLKTDHLIVTTRGTAATTQFVRVLVRKAGEAANIPRRITPHMLRHSTATHLLDSGVDIRHVQKLLGHQSITTTQIYTQVSDSMLKKAIFRGHPMGRIVNK